MEVIEISENLCRICGEEMCGNAFKVPKSDIDIAEKIFKYLPIKEIQTQSCINNFAKTCCNDCVSTILAWDIFYRRCVETQDKYQNIRQLKHEAVESQRSDEYVDELGPNGCIEQENENDKESSNERSIENTETNRFVKSFKQHRCSFCKYVTTNATYHEKHLIAAHFELIFRCDICKTYQSRQELLTHMTKHTVKTVNCKDGTVPSNKTGNLKYKCEICLKKFTSPSGIKYHMDSVHAKLKNFTCDICPLKFSCKRILLNHVRSVHNNEKRTYNCCTCGKQFKTDSTLYAHQKIHSEDKPYTCIHCPEKFRFKHHLTVHALKHESHRDLVFECKICPKKFAARDHLTKHKKIHTKSLIDYVCHICGVKVLQKRYLQEHMKKMHLKKGN